MVGGRLPPLRWVVVGSFTFPNLGKVDFRVSGKTDEAAPSQTCEFKRAADCRPYGGVGRVSFTFPNLGKVAPPQGGDG